MTMLFKTLAAIAGWTAICSSALTASTDRIEHHVAKIDGTRFHYVTAGSGDPVLLLPGWPESWIAWRKVLPLLVSADRMVVVLDPRGFGKSDKPAAGYDLDTAAHRGGRSRYGSLRSDRSQRIPCADGQPDCRW